MEEIKRLEKRGIEQQGEQSQISQKTHGVPNLSKLDHEQELAECSKYQQLQTQQKVSLEINKPLLVLIGGDAASGKTTLTEKIKSFFKQNYQREIITLSTDYYFRKRRKNSLDF